MLRRLLVGLILGFVVGALVAAGLVAGLHVVDFGAGAGGAAFAYLAAALTGVVTGLVAGKPIWASGAKIEAGLKAFFGALIGAGLMFALRQWGGDFTPDLTFIGAGHGAVGQLPAASLPLVAAVLGGFFELDNTGEPTEDKGKDKKGEAGERKRVASEANGKGKRVAEASDDGEEEVASVAPKRAKR